ncbi:MAG: hypothetical protein JWP22_3325, partial [Ramlibacter sp.]|nr:hypothetical protein [Ramlibacter sp.]
GWVHLFDVGPAAAAATGNSGAQGNALRGVTNLFSAPRSTQTGTTAGIRGLEAADLAQAQPNPAAVALLEGMRQTEAEARSFADRSALRPAQVAPLPSPVRSTGQPGGNNPQVSP